MEDREAASLLRAVCELAVVTQSQDWEGGEEGTLDPTKMAKAIVPARWGAAFEVARYLQDRFDHLPLPSPGADPKGFCWLTWEQGPKKFELALESETYRWVAQTSEKRSEHASPRMHDVVQSLRATFPPPSVALVSP